MVMKSPHKDHKQPAKTHWLLLSFFLMIAIVFVKFNATDFKVSVIPTKTHAPYNGTTLPLLKAPDYVRLTSAERNLTYDQMPAAKLLPLPKYDPSILKTSVETLGWSSANDLNIRNSKITFSVPYMGNYKLDGIEYAGSHLAVDIKVPSGTPVYAIGNGFIEKVSNQSTGFGKHIVIRHENFPSLNNPNVKETLYSSYSHLSEISISEGSVVTKGQMIGKTGSTGTSTTPHLHFQIDNGSAPWHPYWPFTYQESDAAGLSFTEAVNAGLNQDKAIKTTVNSMLYVQKYMDGNTSETVTTQPVTITQPVTTQPITTQPVTDLPPSVITDSLSPTKSTGGDEKTTIPEEIITSEPLKPESPAVSFRIVHDGEFVKGVDKVITIEAVDSRGNVVKSYQPHEDVHVKILVGAADIPTPIRKNNFTDGAVNIEITPTANQGLRLIATDNNISGDSGLIKNTMFTDVHSGNAHYQAIKKLKEKGIIQGYPDGSFKPDNVVSRVEALKFIFEGIEKDDLEDGNLSFPDTENGQWYGKYLNTAFGLGIVEGYPDGSFKPTNTVNKVEFLKMLLEAMDNVLTEEITEDIYIDVPYNEWFAPYVFFAKENALIDVTDNRFRPSEGMTRGEVAELIYRLLELNT